MIAVITPTGSSFGGRIVHAKQVMHGKVSHVHHDGHGVFTDIPNDYIATRYHSLAVERATVPAVLEVTGETDTGIVMAVRHRTLDVEGVQFHPESILTEHGHAMLKNFLVRP